VDKNEEILKLYEIYNNSKEKFIDRSFATNKFYLVVEIVLLTIILITNGAPYSGLNVIIPLIGVIVAVMWWLNQDSYGFMIKIKYQSVLEPLEKNFAISPATEESQAIREAAKARKGFVFNNAHKLLAVVTLFIFFALFLAAFVPFMAILLATAA